MPVVPEVTLLKNSKIILPSIYLEQKKLSNFSSALQQEWLITNGLGGYASSTVIGVNTRRYHGLLVAAVKPPSGRAVILSKVEETLVIGGARFNLSCNQYQDLIHPEGYKYLTSFRLDPFPVFTYSAGSAVLEKTIFMLQGHNTTVISYKLLSSPEAGELILRPLIAARDYHWVSCQNNSFNPKVEIKEDRLKLNPYEIIPEINIKHDADQFVGSGYWYKNFKYQREEERGLEDYEDLYSPGELVYVLKEGSSAYLIVSTEELPTGKVEFLLKQEYRLKRKVLANFEVEDDFFKSLILAVDSFVIKRASGQNSILAGYHWFANWGRDALISLPGLTLVTGRFEVAREILKFFSADCEQGLIPNQFREVDDKPEYNSVDVSLWFLYAVGKYLDYTQDYVFVREQLWDKILEIYNYYSKGTRFKISMDKDGLINWQEEALQLTWMDAKIGNWVITPRQGKPVEVNALWYNGLKVIEHLTKRFGLEMEKEVRELSLKVEDNFNKLFWHGRKKCLYDCVDGKDYDQSIRPNQLFSISLPYPVLKKERWEAVFKVVKNELYTPYGLRSLSSKDKNYYKRYQGDQRARDLAYHQGTVWPWFIGSFISAYLKINGRNKKSRGEAMEFISPFRKHLKEAGLGTISEIFDGDAPHKPRGCISQAFSVAEILRAYFEDIK